MTSSNQPDARGPGPSGEDIDTATRTELHAIRAAVQAMAVTDDSDAHARVVRYLIDRFKLSPLSVCPRCRR